MRPRGAQSGAVRLQTLAIMFVAAFTGLIVVPVWAERATGPQDAVLTANTQAVAQVLAIAIVDDEPWLHATPSRASTAHLRRALSRPLTNPVSRSAALVAGEAWPRGEKAPALWITTRADLAPRAIATTPQIRGALAGTIMVVVGRSGIDVFAVPASAGAGIDVHHLAVAQ